MRLIVADSKRTVLYDCNFGFSGPASLNAQGSIPNLSMTNQKSPSTFQPNPIGYETNGKSSPSSLKPQQNVQSIRDKWTPDALNQEKLNAVREPRPWLPSKTLANAMHVFDPKAGCPGEPLGSGTNSPASSSSENVQPVGGRSGEETDTETLNGSEKGRRQLTATASQRLRKWRRLPATNGKSIDEEVLTDTSVDDPPRSGLSVRNQNPYDNTRKQARTLREMRESKRGVTEVPASRKPVNVANGVNGVRRKEPEERPNPPKSPPTVLSVFDRLSTPKRTSPPLERSATLYAKNRGASVTNGTRKRGSGRTSDDNSDDAVSHITSKSHGSDNSSGSSNTSASRATKVTLSSRAATSANRPGDLSFSGRTRSGAQKNPDGSFTTRVSDYTLTSPESPKVVKAALVLSAPTTSRLRH